MFYLFRKRKVCGETNRISELQIYALLRAHSSVDFENTRSKCATYAVKWKPGRCSQRRNLQPLNGENVETFVLAISSFAKLPVSNAFSSFDANTSNSVLAVDSQEIQYNVQMVWAHMNL